MVVVRIRRSLKRFWQLFWSGGEAEQPIVEVMRAASVDTQIKESLFMILRMEHNQRRSAVRSLTARLSIQNAPSTLISALADLEDDSFAEATLKVLEDNL